MFLFWERQYAHKHTHTLRKKSVPPSVFSNCFDTLALGWLLFCVTHKGIWVSFGPFWTPSHHTITHTHTQTPFHACITMSSLKTWNRNVAVAAAVQVSHGWRTHKQRQVDARYALASLSFISHSVYGPVTRIYCKTKKPYPCFLPQPLRMSHSSVAINQHTRSISLFHVGGFKGADEVTYLPAKVV